MTNDMTSADRPKVGFVNFINTSPIYVPWKETGGEPGWDVVEGEPTFLNKLLDQGQIDVGLVSSYFYGLHADKYLIFPDLSISATGPVKSVILLSKVPPEALQGRHVALTPQSATSVNLLKIVLEDFFGVKPEYITGDFDLLGKPGSGAVAYLAIGDEALRLRGTTGFHQLDLAEIWLKKADLPFVFAVWAIRRQSKDMILDALGRLHKKLNECRITGQKRLEDISRLVAQRIPMKKDECLDYLKGIELDLSVNKQKALLHFFNLLHMRGDFPKVDKLDLMPL